MSIVCPWEGLLKDVEFHCKEALQIRFAQCEFFMPLPLKMLLMWYCMVMKYLFFTNDSWPVNFAVLSRMWA
jgi:hypothetical protein